ncbi:stage II sporulation protein P [Lysinibacillus sphaericus]|uniref:stage II sporulation protein P n=1 Tax=Lysinibacillus sphaericus TaxID=1421 RepID=UPI0018CD7D03|nr:stage II sporulation protein P [Lysinibacillus sphaericus]MBG9456111.1 stage II sporulation protein P [Lysinibacillus sphaericus]MBG9477512.1 stage II sporulation protein P [Lysinibacillus sphaericus]MBG9593501.1 stage II sporulation protein P [Lysinibacillus sphaericus]
MQNEKDLFDMLKEMYPQHPRKEFVSATENTLRQRARSMGKKRILTKFSVMTSGVLVCAFIFSWLLFFNENGKFSEIIQSVGGTSSSTAMDEKEPVVYIYHSHNIESFIPEIPAQQVYSDTKNVTLVGKELSRALKELQIPSIHDDTDIAGILKQRGLHFPDSYKVSRENLQKVIAENDSIRMVFDIHRDSTKRRESTIEIKGREYARIKFVVSKTSGNYKTNKRFGTQLHEQLEKLYPGLSIGVIEKGINPQNTYNQELHNNSVLLEVGGVENTLEETYRTIDVFAQVLKGILEE